MPSTCSAQQRYPGVEMVRGMVGQGFGFSVLVTRPHSDITYDGKRVVCVNISER